MKKCILPLFIFFILISNNSCASNQGNNQEYSNFCELVTEAMSLRQDVKSQHEYIATRIDGRVKSNDIKDAYDVVFQVSPDKRYSIFKKSIEEDIGSEWVCGSLKKYFEQ